MFEVKRATKEELEAFLKGTFGDVQWTRYDNFWCAVSPKDWPPNLRAAIETEFDPAKELCKGEDCPACTYLREHGFFVMAVRVGVFLVFAPYQDDLFIGKLAGPGAGRVHEELRQMTAEDVMTNAPPKAEMH